MKITGVKTTLYRNPASLPPSPITESKGASQCLVELSTDSGFCGISVGSGGCPQLQAHIQVLADRCLTGEDPCAATGLWQRMFEFATQHERGGLAQQATGLLDIAVWDLKAKGNQEPLWKTLGSGHPKANVYASAANFQSSDKELQNWFTDMVKRFGFREGKIKATADSAVNQQRLSLMQQILKQNAATPVLMLDVGEQWTAKQTIQTIKALEQDFDITFVEAPCRRGDFLGMKRASDSISAAVCNSPALATADEFLPHFHHHAIDVVQGNMETLGITGLLQLADTAYGFELPITLSRVPGNIQAHIAGALPYFMSMEITDPEITDGVVTTDVCISDGWAEVGDKHGNGLVVDYAALNQAATEPQSKTRHSKPANKTKTTTGEKS